MHELLMTPQEVGRALRLAVRTVQARAQRWVRNAAARSDGNLPSSPGNGLRPVPVASHRWLYDPRDVAEYSANAAREFAGTTLTVWRGGAQ